MYILLKVLGIASPFSSSSESEIVQMSQIVPLNVV